MTNLKELEEKLDPLKTRDNFRDEEGKLYLVRCPKCKLENYALAVAKGQCAWCGWREDDESMSGVSQ